MVDAGCFQDGSTGWGLIMRNDRDKVFLAECKLEAISIDPSLVEAIGLRWCLQKLTEMGLRNMVIRTDATVVVDCIYRQITRAAIEPVIQDCRELLNQLSGITVQHSGRASNTDAHNLVGFSKTLGDRIWSCPEQLCSLIPRCNFSFNCNDIIPV